MSREDAWKKALSAVRRVDSEKLTSSMFSLSSDGFSNSHKNEAEFEKTLSEYFSVIKEHGHSVIDANLKGWLKETSEYGCGDDITLLMAYFPETVDEGPLECEVTVDE